jgi:hypothetical protein
MGNEIKFVFVVEHENPKSGDVKLIGVFRNRVSAREAVAGLKDKDGFSRSKRGFHIGKHELGRVNWEAGFVTVTHEEKPKEK